MSVFFSFHYKRDAWRVQKIIQMGAVEGQPLLNSQAWEDVKRRGDSAIKAWIDEQMKYKSAVVVLVGQQTASRRWVKHEITKAWSDRRPLVGVRIHGLADNAGRTDTAGRNPFELIRLPSGGTIADHVPIFSPSGVGSAAVHANIRANIQTWVTRAYRRP